MTKAGNTTVVSSFGSDKSPSVLATAHGHGKAVFALLHPGFAYFAPALPIGRPADRGSTDENLNHWVNIPWDFAVTPSRSSDELAFYRISFSMLH